MGEIESRVRDEEVYSECMLVLAIKYDRILHREKWLAITERGAGLYSAADNRKKSNSNGNGNATGWKVTV